MNKRLQNKIAESKLALPVTGVYAIVIWLLCGLVTNQWWLQFGCFILSSYLMAELNNINVLIRIYSRMVSCTFLVLSCAACFLFPLQQGAILQLCFVGFLSILFMGHDKESTGAAYYAFLVLGIGSMAFVQIVYFLPLFWLLMGTNLQMLSWRTFSASLLGLLTPYWFGACWLVWQEDFSPVVDHFSQLADFSSLVGIRLLTLNQLVFFTVLCLLTATGIIHYIRSHHGDKIRVRLLYGFFAWVAIFSLMLTVVLPRHYDALIRMAIVCTASLLAHFIALTSTKITNIAFFVVVGGLLLLTGYSLWTLL